MDAGTSFLELVNTYEEEVYTSGTIIEWISGELTFVYSRPLISPLHQISPNVISLLPKVMTITS